MTADLKRDNLKPYKVVQSPMSYFERLASQVGTPNYMATEQNKGKRGEVRKDF